MSSHRIDPSLDSKESLGLTKRRASFSSITGESPLLRTSMSREDLGEKTSLLWELMDSYLCSDVREIQKQIAHHVEYTLASSRFNFDTSKAYRATAHSVRDRLIEAWNDTNQYFDEKDVKRVNYMSLEFLMGRTMQNALLNMDLEEKYSEAIRELGFRLEDLYEEENDAALGNGGLGRLAACFLDSMASLDLPAWGYGIRYNYGIFKQKIQDGYQKEVPDYWLTMGNPWEIERTDVCYPIRFYGHVAHDKDDRGVDRASWEGGEIVQAVAYDNPIPGFDTYNTINLRLWKAAPSREFDLVSFNQGDYVAAVSDRQRAETITSVLYPSDSNEMGKELRLKQQYFFVSATLQDIVRRFKKRLARGGRWQEFAEKNAIQLNDTHPSIGIAELMRILVDVEGLDWDLAWSITNETFAYTNHTILPEALEKWSVGLMEHLLPRHMEIIYKINWHFLEEVVKVRWPGDASKMRELSIIQEEGGRMVRMAHLAIIGSHRVNGVAAIHSELVKSLVFPDFYALWPEKFTNVTNGVTPRRWMNACNEPLSELITENLGSQGWLTDLKQLEGLRGCENLEDFCERWRMVKHGRKERLAEYVQDNLGIDLPTNALFDVQVKRIHEYKRQLLNCLYVIHRYEVLKTMSPEQREDIANNNGDPSWGICVPRVVLFGGKAAPGYVMAKRIIKLIHNAAEIINNDPDMDGLLRLVFIPNYCVSNAEIIIPASELSQHISTAGMEASGTSNMKFAMNGGLIIGTRDGANIEIAEEIGEANMFIFGANADEVQGLRNDLRFKPAEPCCEQLQSVIDLLASGKYGSHEDINPILDSLRWENDYYLIAHDFPSYLRAQAEVDALYLDQDEWTRRSILSTAGMGKFSTDRTITEYAENVWDLVPARRPEPTSTGMGARVRSFPSFQDESLTAVAAQAGAPNKKAPSAKRDVAGASKHSDTRSPVVADNKETSSPAAPAAGVQLSGASPKTPQDADGFVPPITPDASQRTPSAKGSTGQPKSTGGRRKGRGRK